MKAAIQERFGSPQVLSVREVKRPLPKPGEILISVHASSVTQGDRRLRAADYPGVSALFGRLMFGIFSPKNPTGGTNFAGRVVEVGDEVTGFSVGDDVFGGCDHGAYAEYLALSQDAVVAKMPPGMLYEDASAVPYGAVTALTFLREVAQVKAGERVLIVGASGGVGRFAVQLARHLGAHVTGVCSKKKFSMVTELGAHAVIDYRSRNLSQGNDTYDLVLDTHSGGGFQRVKGSLSPRGRYVTLYLNVLVLLQMMITSFARGRRVMSSVALGDQALLRDVAHLVEGGAIWPVVAERFPLSNIREAHEALESKDSNGTVVVCMTEALRGGQSVGDVQDQHL